MYSVNYNPEHGNEEVDNVNFPFMQFFNTPSKINGMLISYFDLKLTNNHWFTFFEKYFIHNERVEPEERYLGLFRLVENLNPVDGVYVAHELLEDCLASDEVKGVFRETGGLNSKSMRGFFSHIRNTNDKKKGVADALQGLYIKVPEEIRDSWNYMIISPFKKGLGDDVKTISFPQLRNNIAHANSYKMGKMELTKRTKFIEVLLLVKLFELLGVNASETSEAFGRLDQYKLIIR